MSESNKVPEVVSYNALLLELARRLRSGWRPKDPTYFSELASHLLRNDDSLAQRIIEQGFDAEMLGPCDSVN